MGALSSFHAAFSAGGLIGAAAGGLAAAGGVDPAAHFAAVAVALALVALTAAGRLLPRGNDGGNAVALVRPPRALVMLGVAAFFTLLAEGAAADWSAVYLHGSLGAGAATAALGYTTFSLTMVASRPCR